MGAVTHGRVPYHMRERLRSRAASRNSQGGGKSKGSKGDDPKFLTSKIKKAENATELLSVLDAAVDRPIFNEFHASAACWCLPLWHRFQVRPVT